MGMPGYHIPSRALTRAREATRIYYMADKDVVYRDMLADAYKAHINYS